MTFIGRGEKTCEEILNRLIGQEWQIKTQVGIGFLYNLRAESSLPTKDDFVISPEHLRSSIDILVVKKEFSGQLNYAPDWEKDQMIAFRVQGGKGKGKHTGIIKSRRDSVQRDLLNEWKVSVIDIREWNCPELFKEKFNFKSITEVMDEIKCQSKVF